MVLFTVLLKNEMRIMKLFFIYAIDLGVAFLNGDKSKAHPEFLDNLSTSVLTRRRSEATAETLPIVKCCLVFALIESDILKKYYY